VKSGFDRHIGDINPLGFCVPDLFISINIASRWDLRAEQNIIV